MVVAARAVYHVTKDASQPRSPRRLITCSKLNIAAAPASLAFEVKGNGTVSFESAPVDITSDEAFSQAAGYDAPERNRAVNWLKEILSQVDSMPSNEIFKLAEENGFKKSTLQEARKILGVKCSPVFDSDGNKSWHWALPSDKNKKKTNVPGLQKILDGLPKIPKASIHY